MPSRKRTQSSGPTLVGIPAPDMVDGASVPVLEKRLAAIRRCKQVQSDANTEHASAWKALEEAGVASNQGWKWGIKLERMEATKRAAVLASFDEARRHLNLDAQLELQLEDIADRLRTDVGSAGAAAIGEIDGSALDEAADQLFGKTEELDPEWQPPAERPDDPAFNRGGVYYGGGRDAGLDGQELPDNPHPSGSVEGGLWEAGWREGVRLRTAPPPLGSDRPEFPEAAA